MQQSGELLSTSEAAATLTVGTDVFRNERKRTSSRLRYVTGLSIIGGNAVNEAAVDVYIEDYFVGRFRNSRAGVAAAIYPDDFQPVKSAAVPPGSQISGVITVAPTVSPLLIKVYGFER
jgi:hypothetical protein